MDNNRLNLTRDQLELLLSIAGKRLGTNPENLKTNLEAGKYDHVLSKMNSFQAATLNRVLSNPKELEKMLNNPKIAQKLKEILK